MKRENKELNPTQKLIGEVARVILYELVKIQGSIKKSGLNQILLDNRDIYKEKRVFSDEDFAFGINNKVGTERWYHFLSFAGGALEYARYISRKKRGFWEIEDEGKEALRKDEKELNAELGHIYSDWSLISRQNKKEKSTNDEEENNDPGGAVPKNFDTDDIRSDIYDYIERFDPYDFQQLVAYLFQGMGYSTPYIAEKGPDGGIDIIAHKDPIGVHDVIKIQVKHTKDRNNPGISMDEVRSFRSLCADGSHGVFVSMRGFTRETEKNVRTDQGSFVTLIDSVRFVNLWIEHINTIPEEGRKMLPLRKEYVLDIVE